jgi:hypothetical protein
VLLVRKFSHDGGRNVDHYDLVPVDTPRDLYIYPAIQGSSARGGLNLVGLKLLR